MNTEPGHERNPLHGVTLERMLNELVEHIGWERMARRVKIACFTTDPSVSSSLRFLRRTPWARTKVEAMYLDALARKQQHDARKAADQRDRGVADRSITASDADRSLDDRSEARGVADRSDDEDSPVTDTPAE